MKVKHMWKHPKILAENICLFIMIIGFIIYSWIVETFTHKNNNDAPYS